MSKLIVLDAGHGKNTAGKRCMSALDLNQTREWTLNDRIADRLQELLAGYECHVMRVDDTTGSNDIALSARVKLANTAKADVYISIHHNAGISGGNGGGTEVYYYSGNAKRLEQAKKLYDKVIDKTGLKGNRSQPVRKHAFYVLQKTGMPAFLIENGYMDSRTDTPVILTAEHAEKTAQGILAFLVEEFVLQPKSLSMEPAATQGDIYYPAYTGKKTTLSSAMISLGINSTYAFRKKIATANNIIAYSGTAAQNTQMYNLLVAGLLKKA